mgnify:CR=1 FL=1
MQSSGSTYKDGLTISLGTRLKAYTALVKPRLTMLVVFSAMFGYFMAPNVGGFEFMTIAALALGGFLITGASNTLNQVIEIEQDSLMNRTQKRPLVQKVISPLEAIIFAMVTGIAGIVLLGVMFEGIVAALLGIIALLSYAFVYTPMKRIHSVGVLIGAIPGAMPPLIGWAAATGNLGIEAWILFLVQFLWQFPHFWAIAWVLDEDYKRGGFKMLPANGGRTAFTASVILVYTILLVPVCILPYSFEMVALPTAIIMAVAGMAFTAQAWFLLRVRTVKAASRLMFGSFIYLPVVQIAMLIDKF